MEALGLKTPNPKPQALNLKPSPGPPNTLGLHEDEGSAGCRWVVFRWANTIEIKGYKEVPNMSGIFLEVPMISVTLFSGLYWGEPKSKLRRGRVLLGI